MKTFKLATTVNKVCVISDIHLGLHCDSEQWHKIILDYGHWLANELTKKNINTLFILGDIFNDREEVGVNTLSIAEKFFSIFKDFNVVILNGNHDSYLKESSEINSIAIFKGWSNIHVIDQPEILTLHNHDFGFCPWGANPADFGLVDMLFGHFEIMHFNKTPFKLCEMGYDSEDLLKYCKKVFSGHYHIRQERSYKNGKIVYVGCPYSQSWTDYNSPKYYYILDLTNLEYESFPNTISPQYHKIKVSDLFDKDKLNLVKTTVPNNFINLIRDIEIDNDKFEKLIQILSAMKPQEIICDSNTDSPLITDKDYEMVHMDTKSLLEEFVANLEISNIKDKVLVVLEDIYNKALNRVKIESD